MELRSQQGTTHYHIGVNTCCSERKKILFLLNKFPPAVQCNIFVFTGLHSFSVLTFDQSVTSVYMRTSLEASHDPICSLKPVVRFTEN